MSSLSLSAPTIFTSTINPYASEVLIDARLDMNSNRIENVGAPINAGDAMNLTFGDSRYVLKAGDTMRGDLDMGGNGLLSVANINTSTLLIGQTGGTTPYLRLTDGGSWFYIQTGNQT